MRPLLVLLLAAAVLADEESARYFLTRGERAMEAGRLDEAQKFLERSLGELKDYAPTLLALARLAQRRGKKEDAVKHLEAVLAKKGTALSAEERRAVKDAEELMAQIDAARVAFETLLDGYVDSLLRVASGAEKRNPELAQACYRQILVVKPAHPEALRRAQREPEKEQPKKPAGEPIFNGKDLEEWTGKAPAWTVDAGILHARLEGIAQINRYRKEVEGSFVYECELRLVETLGKDPLVGLLFGGRGPYDHFGVWVWRDAVSLERQPEEGKRSDLQRRGASRLPGRFSRGDWHVYRIAVEEKRITVSLDGKEIFSFAGADRQPGGYVGLWVQDSRVEIRRATLER